MLIAQLSDVHVGGSRYREELLRTAIEEVNTAEPDLVVVAGDLTDEGYPDQYPLARQELAALACNQVVRVPGNHDARNVGYLRYEDTFGARDSRERLDCDGLAVALVAVDSSKPDLDEGEIGREHYGWIEEGFAGDADLRVFVCHHHLVPVPGTGRERNQVLDAGTCSRSYGSAASTSSSPATHPGRRAAEPRRLPARLAGRAFRPRGRPVRARTARRPAGRRPADAAASLSDCPPLAAADSRTECS